MVNKLTNCPFCGTKLLDTSYGRKYCPNHGIVSEEDPKEGDSKKEYIR